jgi:hypothetical protein
MPLDESDWIPLLEEMSSHDLTRVEELIVKVKAHRMSSDRVGRLFMQLREGFKAGENPRFSSSQVNVFKPWDARKEEEQKQFKEAWAKAVSDFTDKGFTDNKRLHGLIIRTVVNSPYFKDKLLWSLMLDSLSQAYSLFEDQWPYVKTHGLTFIRENLDDNRSTNTSRESTTERPEPAAV